MDKVFPRLCDTRPESEEQSEREGSVFEHHLLPKRHLSVVPGIWATQENVRNDPRMLQDAAKKSLHGFFEVINAPVKSKVSYSALI